MNSYTQQLKSPRWQAKRLEIFLRAGFKCEACDRDNEPLHVHHLRYPKWGLPPWDVPNEHLECLCETCHACRTEWNAHTRKLIELTPTRGLWDEEYRSGFVEY